ncbi:acyl-CoA dehydrogenase family protein, partial [Streptomyces daliensis]|nr:acyl-CoA dehydrogenase family protein [Streptomyces daliensis]
MVDFSLSTEERQIRDTVRAFITKEVMPLEAEVLRNERAGAPAIDRDVLAELRAKARKSGFWGVSTPEEYGGMNLGAVMTAILTMETGRTFVPFTFGGAADNILYHCDEEQKREYLVPTIEGRRRSCFAITEPGAGSDARNIRTRAVRDGDDWVINGEKTFITGGNEADFVMVFAVTDPEKGADGGVTCFLADRDMGWKSEPIPTMGQWGPASLVFDDVRVPARNVLGEVGQGYPLAMRWIGRGRYL